MWPHLIAAILGIWLMEALDLLGYGPQAAIANNDHIIGPLAARVGLVAASEAIRNVRWLNIPLSLWLLMAA